MKIKLLAIAVTLSLSGCYETVDNVPVENTVKISDTYEILRMTVDSHDYIRITEGYTHSGSCRRCKQERDSIVNLIIKTIKENKSIIIWE